MILTSDMWEGKRCFILGGGPSLTGFNFDLIKNECTIGINKAFMYFPTTLNYSMDLKFHDQIYAKRTDDDKKLYEAWINYKGIKIFLKVNNKYKFDPSVTLVNKLDQKVISFDVNKGIHSGNNSGAGALFLAISLGVKEIFLLGYDLKVNKLSKKTHFHSGYDGQDVDNFPKKLNNFIRCFEEFALSIKNNGVNVINLNPDSALTCFPFSTIENVMNSHKTS
jgi:hypothetical protein